MADVPLLDRLDDDSSGADFATGKPVDLSKSEEKVWQEYEWIFVEDNGYAKEDLDIEVQISRGTVYFPDRADIVIYDDSECRDPTHYVLGIVETKRPTRKGGIKQIKPYMTATSSAWVVWTNVAYLYRGGISVWTIT